MNLYLAGVYANNLERSGRNYMKLQPNERIDRDRIVHYLESFHYLKEKMVISIRNEKEKIFLDSGAYSFFSKGAHVDLDDYIDFVKENIDIIKCENDVYLFSVLDDITSAENTYNNQKYIESKGITPLPCFHYGEDIEYLKYYVDNYDYITLGGMVPISTKALFLWLDNLWGKYLLNSDGTSKIKIHGFGLTTIPLMDKYPWHSVDSATWVQQGNFGCMIHPDYFTVHVSSKSPSRKQKERHFSNLPPSTKQHLLEDINKRGYEIERLENVYLSRWAYNLGSFVTIGDNIGIEKFEQQEFLYD